MPSLGLNELERPPAVAGSFYPGSVPALRQQLERCLERSATPHEVTAVVVPHAGYMYSGAIAGKVFGQIKMKPRVVILCPNHTGRGATVAVFPGGVWRTPLGEAPVDEVWAAQLLEQCRLATPDTAAHAHEHSAEVEVPFLQALAEAAGMPFSILPIAVKYLGLPQINELAEALARVVGPHRRGTLLVASTDMNHYESATVGRQKDEQALARVLKLDVAGLVEVVRAEQISMCGVIPTAVVLQAATLLGATAVELVAYGNSGDVSGDYQQVVGYAGLLVS